MNKTTVVGRRVRPGEMLLYCFIFLSALAVVLLSAGIILYVAARGMGQISWSFLTGVTSALSGTVGIAGNLVNTLYLIVNTLLLATPIGVGSAVYLNEYAKGGRLVRLIVFTTEILAGVPSIIFGLFGMLFFGKWLGYSILTGAFTMTLMTLPLITRSTQEALKTVTDSYRQGALGLGAERWHMIRTVLLPTAMPGIVTGVILAVGRMIGESAALLFTAGSGYFLPRGLFSKLFESGGTLTVQLYLSMSKGEYKVAFGIAFVLLILVLGMNLLAKLIGRRLYRRSSGE